MHEPPTGASFETRLRRSSGQGCWEIKMQQALQRPRQPVLERPHPARRTQVMSPARHARRVGQSDNMLLGPLRAVDDCNQNAAWADETAKRFTRWLDETMDNDPIETFPRHVMLESVRPNHRDVRESKGLDSRRRFDRQRLESFKRHDRVRKLGQ
jgi:hypothetical protein